MKDSGWRAFWRSLARGLPVLILAAALSCIWASSALALRTYVVSTSFGTGDGQIELNLGEHSGVAVNQATHNLYIADTFNHRIVEFDPSKATGEQFLRAFGADVGGPGVNVCIASCLPGTPGTSPGAFEEPTFVAVDNSGGPSQGDVYIADTTIVSKFDSTGALVAGWGTGGQIVGHEAEPFGEIAGLAVDSGGNLDVFEVEPRLILRYDEGGMFLGESETARGTSRAGFAVDPGGNFFKVNGSGAVQKFDPTGTNLGQVTQVGSTTGLAIDPSNPNGELFVDQGGSVGRSIFLPNGEIEVQGSGCPPIFDFEFEAGCPFTESFGQGAIAAGAGLAVDGSSHIVYVADAGPGRVLAFVQAVFADVTVQPATEIADNSATLNGTISAAGGSPATCEFEYTTEEAFETIGFTGAATAPCAPLGPFTGTASQAVSAKVAGLTAGVGYAFRLVATNEEQTSTSAVASFSSASAPAIEGFSVTTTATTARVSGQIDPRGLASTFVVEYVPESQFLESGFLAAFSAPTPPAAIPAFTLGIADLTEGSNRVAAVGVGEPRRFIVQSGHLSAGQVIRGPGIPVGTVVESVTPTELVLSKAATASIDGAPFVASGSQPAIQVLTGLAPGTRYRYRIAATNTLGTVVGGDATFATFLKSAPILPDGRAYEMVSPPRKLGEVIPPEPSIGALGPGTCSHPPAETVCVPGAGVQLMPMQAAPDGGAVTFLGQPFFEGIASGPNLYLARRGPAEWGTQSLSEASFETGSGKSFTRVSADLSRSIRYQTEPPLSADAATSEGKGFDNLYIVSGGSYRPVITATPPNRSPGRPGGGGNQFKVSFLDANDGADAANELTHVLFQANDSLTPEVPGIAPAAPEVGAGNCRFEEVCNLYEWVNGTLRLVNVLPGNGAAAKGAVDLGSAQSGASEEGSDFDHAISDDGSRIFWTELATGQVYVRINGEITQELTDHVGTFLSASTDGSKAVLTDGCLYQLADHECIDLTGGNGGFVGILGASDDLSTIYFVDTAVITGAAENANGEHAEGGSDNLYVRSGGDTIFLGALLPNDNLTAATPPIAGDWKPSSSSRTAQVTPSGRYLAFMSSASLTGYDNNQLDGKCYRSEASLCNEVFEYDLASNSLSCASCNPSGGRPLGGSNINLILRGGSLKAGFPQPENLTNEGEGRLFFESQDTLSPQDSNGRVQDIYAWQPMGVDGCTEDSGCIALISSGQTKDDSYFLNATPSGNDIFFVTRQRLLTQDTDERLDVYDARVNGGFKAADASPPCRGEECRGPVSGPPALPSPNSPAFHGAKKHKPHGKKKRKHRKQKHHRNHKTQAGRVALPHTGGSK